MTQTEMARGKAMRAVVLAVALAVACFAAVLSVQAVSAQPASEDYSITDLGTLGGSYSDARAVNDRGQVVGLSETASGEFHVFLWEKGKMIDFGTLGGAISSAYAINNRGQIIGDSSTASGESRAVLWTR